MCGIGIEGNRKGFPSIPGQKGEKKGNFCWVESKKRQIKGGKRDGHKLNGRRGFGGSQKEVQRWGKTVREKGKQKRKVGLVNAWVEKRGRRLGPCPEYLVEQVSIRCGFRGGDKTLRKEGGA